MRTLIRRREWPVWVIKTWGKRDLFKAFVALIGREGRLWKFGNGVVVTRALIYELVLRFFMFHEWNGRMAPTIA